MLKAVTTKKVFYTSATFLGYSRYVNGFCFSKWLARSHYSSESTGTGSDILQYDKKTRDISEIKKYADKFIDGGTAIIQQASSAASVAEIFDLIQNNVNNMSGRECVAVLQTLYVILQDTEKDINVEDIRNRKEIIELSNSLKRHIRMIPLMDVITALKVFLFLKTPTSSIMCQSLLQMIARMSNDLTVNQILFLNRFIMKDVEPCPLSDALNVALPIVFNAKAKIGLKSRNIATLINMFHYGARNNVDSEVLDVIVKNLTEIKEIFYFQTNVEIVRTFLSMNTLEDSQLQLYDFCLQQVAAGLNGLSLDEVSSLVSKMANQFVVVDRDEFYDEPFLYAVVSYILENELSFESTASLLKSLNVMGFVSIELLDYMDSLLLSCDNFAEIKSPKLIATYLNGLSVASYKPNHWDMYKDRLTNALDEHKYYGNYSVAAVVYDLMCLDCWNDKLIEFVFSEDFGELTTKDKGRTHNDVLVKIYQAVATLYPGGYKNSLPPYSLVENLIDKIMFNQNTAESPSLISAVQYCLGGDHSDFILSGVYTKFGHFIDHLIVLQNDCPVSIDNVVNQTTATSSGKMRIDDLKFPVETKLIAILLFDHPYACTNVNKLTGYTGLYVRSLESLDIKPIPIILAEWDDLPDNEKIPFLQMKLDNLVKGGDDTDKNEKVAVV